MSTTGFDGDARAPWRPLAAFALALALAGWFAAGFYTVRGGDGEVGVALRFGRVVAERVPGGVHWNPPWPIGAVVKVKTAERFTMSVGFRMEDDLNGREPLPAELQWLTGDTNIIDLRAIFQYQIADPVAYSFGTAERAGFLLRRAAETTFTEVVGARDVDGMLTDEKHAVLARVVAGTNALLERYGAGIVVADASFRSVEPATRVQWAFREVQNAAADKARKENEAHGYANDLVPRARGEANTIVVQAQADAASRVERARGEADRFRKLLVEYQRAPESTRERLYLETVEQVLGRARLVMLDGDTDLTLFDDSASAPSPAR